MPLDLHSITWGRGDRSILLLHGITSDARGWWRLGPDLAQRGWEVTAVDLRGHGESPSGADYALASYAGDVLALADRWDAVLGHSLGGAVAVVAAGLRPGYARRLVLVDPALLTGLVDPGEAVEALLAPYRRPATTDAVAADNPSWHPEDCRLKAEALPRCPPGVVRATIYGNPDWNLIAGTARLTVPTTIIGGDPAHGGIVPVTVGEWFADEVPNLDYVMIPGSGHSIHREVAHYDAFVAAVLAALEVER